MQITTKRHPTDIKKAALALIISCISFLIAVYFDGLEFKEMGFNDSFTIGVNIIWALVIAWIIWDLYKGKDIKLTLVIVGAIMSASLTYDFFEYGFGVAQAFYSVELLMFVYAYILVRSENSRAWYSENNL